MQPNTAGWPGSCWPCAGCTGKAAGAPGGRSPHGRAAGAVRTAVEEVTGRAGLPSERLTMEEKIRIVENLHRAGLFSMKGAVSEVAAQLGASEATVYRYLSKLKG